MAEDREQSILNNLNGFDVSHNVDQLHGKYLTFLTDGQTYGIPIADVVQIVGVQDITQIPEYPYYAKGIINLRGSIIPIIDMRLRFGKEEIPYTERTCIIVTSINKKLIGFVVDGVDEVTEIPDEVISPPPDVSGESTSTYIVGIGKQENRVTILLDTRKILGDESFSFEEEEAVV